MATEIFLGEPPTHIKQWIIDHSKPQFTELCFTAEEANSSIKLIKKGSTAIAGFNGLEYKKVSATPLLAASADEWKPYTIGSFGQNNELSGLNVGDKVYMRAVAAGNSQMGKNYGNYHQFIMSGKIAASGNINTLLNPDPNVDVSLEGKAYCYYNMFSGCSSLTQAPALPAMTLAIDCYGHMFGSCSSLTQAPALPAMTLADECYYNMFSGCSSLTQAPALPAMTLADNCYTYMFHSCSSLTQAPALPAMTLAVGCYYEMFVNCSSLTQAPELPAMTLTDGCYSNMFYGTQQLQEITFNNLSTTEVVNLVKDMGLGIPYRQVVICYCRDGGVVIINDNDDSSSGENNSIS